MHHSMFTLFIKVIGLFIVAVNVLQQVGCAGLELRYFR